MATMTSKTSECDGGSVDDIKEPSQQIPEDEEGAGDCDIASPLEALDEWRRQAEANESNVLAKPTPGTVVAGVQPGVMRLMGNFEGTAITSTHQLDLALGLDLEMPSQVAAEAMKQLEARSVQASPVLEHRMVQQPGSAPPPEPRSLFSSLASFFRSDAQEARRRYALENGSTFSDLRLKLSGTEDSDKLRDERDELALGLSVARAEVANREISVRALTTERDELLVKVEACGREQETQAAHIEGLRRQVDSAMQSGQDLNSLLVEREGQIRELDGKLAEALRASGERSSRSAAQAGLEKALEAARAAQQQTLKDMEVLKTELGVERARNATLEAKLKAVSVQQESKVAAAQKEGSEQVQGRLKDLAGNLRSLADERDELRKELGATQASAEAARSQAREVEAQLGPLAARAAEAQALYDEAHRTAEIREQEISALQAKLAQAVPFDQSSLGAEESKTLQTEVQSLRTQGQALRKDLDHARTQAAAAAASKAAAEAQVLHLEASAKRTRQENEELAAKAGTMSAERQACESSIRELQQQLESAQRRLIDVDGSKLVNQVECDDLRNQVRAEAAVAAEAMQQQKEALEAASRANAELAEVLRRRDDEALRVAAEAEALAAQMDALQLEARTAQQRAAQAAEDRDRACQELREARHGDLGADAKLREELNETRQQLARDQGHQAELERYKDKCAALEASLDQTVQDLDRHRNPTMHTATPVIIQDALGGCVIRSIPSTVLGTAVTTKTIPMPVPTVPGRKIGNITHVGTTIGPMGHSASFQVGPPRGSLGHSVQVPGPHVTAVGTGVSRMCTTGSMQPVQSGPVPIRAAVTVQVVQARRVTAVP